MEAFNIADELQQWAEAKGWVFLLGDQFYANIEATEDYDVSDEQFRQIDAGQPVLWCNLEANETRAIGNRVSAINYTGLLGLGIKKDADYSVSEDAKTNANLDETFKQKYDRRLKELLQLLSDEMKKFTCSNNLQILSSSYVYDINKFETNIDFVIGTFDIEQESFTVVPNEVDLTLTAEPGGSVEPYEGTQAQNKYSSVPINAVPDTNYAFKEWIIDGVKVLDKLTSVFMNRAKSAIAYFESSLQVIQDLFSTNPERIGDYFGYKNQIIQSDLDVNIIIYANSIGEQSFSMIYGWVDYFREQINTNLGVTAIVKNISEGGITGQTLLDEFNARVLPEVESGKRNIMIYFEGINDIQNGATETEAYEHLRDIGLLAQSNGIEPIICTSFNTTSTVNSVNTKIPLLNTNLITNYATFASALFDFAAISEMVDPSNKDTFLDGTHPSVLGNTYINSFVLPEMLGYLNIEDTNVKVKNTMCLKTNRGATVRPLQVFDNFSTGNNSYAVFVSMKPLQDFTAGTIIPIFLTGIGRTTGNRFYIRNQYFSSATTIKIEAVVEFDNNTYTFIEKIDILKQNNIVLVIDRESNEITLNLVNGTFTEDITGALGNQDNDGRYILVGDSNKTAEIEHYHYAVTNKPTAQQIEDYLLRNTFTVDGSDVIVNYDFETGGGLEAYDSGVNKHTGDINASGLTEWIESSENIEPKSLTKGCEVYTDGANNRAVNYGQDGLPQGRTIAGFTNEGNFKNVGILSGLYNLFDNILGIGKDAGASFVDVDEVKIIPKEDLTINNKEEIIEDFACQPYEQYVDKDGNPVYTSEGKEFNVIKSF